MLHTEIVSLSVCLLKLFRVHLNHTRYEGIKRQPIQTGSIHPEIKINTKTNIMVWI